MTVIKTPESSVVLQQPKILERISNVAALIRDSITDIFRETKSPEEICMFCEELTQTAIDVYNNDPELYQNAKTSQTFVQNVEHKIRELVRKNKYFDHSRHNEDGYSFFSSTNVTGISAEDIEKVDALWLHKPNPEKHYSINGVGFILRIPEHDIDALLKSMIPIDITLNQNEMTSIEEQYEYYHRGDLILKHIPGTDTFHFDAIDLIKETNIADKDCYDGFNLKKLVGITKPFPSIREQGVALSYDIHSYKKLS